MSIYEKSYILVRDYAEGVMSMSWFPRLLWLEDLFWCFIPKTCRDCDDLRNCRSGFWRGRKCFNGCIKVKRKEAYRMERERSDYIDNLVKDVEYQESIKE